MSFEVFRQILNICSVIWPESEPNSCHWINYNEITT